MKHNAHFWARLIHDVFLPEVKAMRRGVLEKLLPSFTGIEQEADATTRAAYDELGRHGPDWLDEATAAELAHERGVDHYLRMVSVRQGLLNLATAGLFHLFEQQMSQVVRKALLTPAEEHDPDFLRQILKPNATMKTFALRLEQSGIRPRDIAGYGVIVDELRLVANAVKHGMGDSGDALHARRPQLFVAPSLRDDPLFNGWSISKAAGQDGFRAPVRLSRPMMGDDLYVLPEDFDAYAASVAQFWEGFASTLAKMPQR